MTTTPHSESGKLTFFSDECLGRLVPNTLIKAGVPIKMYADCFRSGIDDTEWIPLVVERGWVILTKDPAIGRRISEQAVLAQAGAKVFAFRSGQVKSEIVIEAFIKAYPKMLEIAETTEPPFIAKVYKSGEVKLWKNSSTLRDIVNKFADDGEA